MNEVLLFVQILISFLGVVVAYKFFGRVGLFVAAGAVTLFANLEVAGQCNMFGLAVSLGNVAFVANSLIQDTLNENEGEGLARWTVWFGFLTCLLIFAISQVSIRFVPNEYDIIHDSFKLVFDQFSIVTLVSLGTYLISNLLNVKLYGLSKKFTDKVWLRSQFSTSISQFVDTVIMTVALCVLGVFPWESLIHIVITTYVIKYLVVVCEIPFLYITKTMKQKGFVREVL